MILSHSSKDRADLARNLLSVNPRSSLKERSRVKGVVALFCAVPGPLQARFGGPSAWRPRAKGCALLPGCCRFGGRAGLGQGPGGSPAAQRRRRRP